MPRWVPWQRPAVHIPEDDEVRAGVQDSKELSRAYNIENIVSIIVKNNPEGSSNLPSKDDETTDCGKMAVSNQKSAEKCSLLGPNSYLVFTLLAETAALYTNLYSQHLVRLKNSLARYLGSMQGDDAVNKETSV